MSIEEFLEELRNLIDDSESDIINAVRRNQRRILRDILAIADTISTRTDGSIRPGKANRDRLLRIKNELDSIVLNKNYLDDVSRFQSAFDKVEAINSEWYATQFSIIDRLGTLADITLAAKDQAIQSMTTNALNAGLKQPVERVIQGYLQGGSLQDLKNTFINNVLTIVKEEKGEITTQQLGYLESNVNRYVRDSLNQFSRGISDAVIQATDAEFIRYTGGLIRDSRDFCVDRVRGNGKFKGSKGYYHINEVKSWAKQQWQGKHKDTTESNILRLLGGYNCRHDAIAVETGTVPQSAIDRAIKLGWYSG